MFSQLDYLWVQNPAGIYLTERETERHRERERKRERQTDRQNMRVKAAIQDYN